MAGTPRTGFLEPVNREGLVVCRKDELTRGGPPERAHEARRIPIGGQDTAGARGKSELHVRGRGIPSGGHHADLSPRPDRRNDRDAPAIEPVELNDDDIGPNISEQLERGRIVGDRPEDLESRPSAEAEQQILCETEALADHEDADRVHHLPGYRHLGVRR